MEEARLLLLLESFWLEAGEFSRSSFLCIAALCSSSSRRIAEEPSTPRLLSGGGSGMGSAAKPRGAVSVLSAAKTGAWVGLLLLLLLLVVLEHNVSGTGCCGRVF